MLLTSAAITDYRSIDDSSEFEIDKKVTAFVGLNESGKTCVLQSIHKALSKTAEYNVDADYPRKKLATYQREKTKPSIRVAKLQFSLSSEERAELEQEFGKGVLESGVFIVTFNYDESSLWGIPVSAKKAISHIAQQGKQIPGFKELVESAETVREVISKLSAATLDAAGTALRDTLKKKFPEEKNNETEDLLWRAVLTWLRERMPETFYFDDYYTLPAKINLADLLARKGRDDLQEPHQTIVALLEVSGVTIEELMTPNGFESARARLEGISANISDRIFKYWKQNDSIEVEFHVADDPKDIAPFNNGKNFYVRIKNNRHRVTMPLSNRSKGFIWFFSFLIWFDKIQSEEGHPPILLLDEPGLNLHALAQHDLLAYIDTLAQNQQVLYTTHSPFMVESSKLSRVRVVEDKPKEGTRVSSNISSSNKNTLFPLQAALGYTIAQNLFIQRRNLLVEGPSDLILLRFMSSALEQAGRTGLRDDIAITPCGGSAKIATFVALLDANDLELASLTDYSGKDDQHLTDLVRQKILSDNQVLHFAQFRSSGTTLPTDIEDLVNPSAYVEAFNQTYAKTLGQPITESELPAGSRILERISELLEKKNLKVRPSGGFNHYAVVQTLASDTYVPDAATLSSFENIFRRVNSLYSS